MHCGLCRNICSYDAIDEIDGNFVVNEENRIQTENSKISQNEENDLSKIKEEVQKSKDENNILKEQMKLETLLLILLCF